jgi:hypothetical protein
MTSTEQKEQERAKDKQTRETNASIGDTLGTSETDINNAASSDLKPTGAAALQKRILNQGKTLLVTILPALIIVATQAGLSELKAQTPKLPDLCPNSDLLKSLIQKRNEIVNMLNQIGSSLNATTITLTGVSLTYDTISNLILTTNTIIPIAESTLAATPPPALPGAPVVALSKLKDLIRDNKPKIDKYKSIIDNTALAISLVSITITVIVNILKSLDALLSKCDPTSNLIPVSNNLSNIAEQQQSNNITEQIKYKGFEFQIETVPYTPTVNRIKAVAINSSGIKLIETALSFTENQQTLINELKFIIDRDNLKAN